MKSVEIGVDIDTCDKQYTHLVIGVAHEDKHAFCNADTLWGYYAGALKDVTCPKCLDGLLAARRAK